MRRVFHFPGEPWKPQELDVANAAANFGHEDSLVRGLKDFWLSCGNWVGLGKQQLELAGDQLQPFVERLGCSFDPKTPSEVHVQ